MDPDPMTKTKNPSSNNKYAPTFFPVLMPSGKKIEASCFFIRHRKNHAGRMYTRSEPVSAPVRPKHVARFGITMESPKDVPTRNTVSKTKYLCSSAKREFSIRIQVVILRVSKL